MTAMSSSATRVRDIMTAPVVTAKVDDDVRLAAQVMLWGGFHHLPVVDHETLVGIVTDREVNRSRVDKGRVEVGDVMVRDPVITTPDALIEAAADTMADAFISCLPVINEGQLVGMLTTTDLLTSVARRRLAPDDNEERVGDMMTRGPHTTHASTPLARALAVMVEHGIRHLPVVSDDNRLVGMLSDRDVRTAVGDPLAALCDGDFGPAAELTVKDVMRPEPVVSVFAHEPMSMLVWGFADQRVGAIVVVDDERRVVGIVSYVDLVHRAARRHA